MRYISLSEMFQGGKRRHERHSCSVTGHDRRPGVCFQRRAANSSEGARSYGRRRAEELRALDPDVLGWVVQTVTLTSLTVSVLQMSLWVLAPKSPAYRSVSLSRKAGWGIVSVFELRRVDVLDHERIAAVRATQGQPQVVAGVIKPTS